MAFETLGESALSITGLLASGAESVGSGRAPRWANRRKLGAGRFDSSDKSERGVWDTIT